MNAIFDVVFCKEKFVLSVFLWLKPVTSCLYISAVLLFYCYTATFVYLPFFQENLGNLAPEM